MHSVLLECQGSIIYVAHDGQNSKYLGWASLDFFSVLIFTALFSSQC